MKEAQLTLTTLTPNRQSSREDRLADLQALRTLSAYLREELLRLESDLFWSVAILPEALDHEIACERQACAQAATRTVTASHH